MTLLLARPVMGGAAATFIEALEARVGAADGPRVLDLDILERAGMLRSGPLSRARFHQWLADRAAKALRSGAVERKGRTRFPIFIVGPLGDRTARRSVMNPAKQLSAATRRLTMPRGVEPFPIAIWMLPDRWTALEGAELFAWLKEITHVLATYDGTGSNEAACRLNILLGRSAAEVPEPGTALSVDDHGLAIRAAEFVAASLTTRVLDWALAADRGRRDTGGLYALGIAPLPTSADHEASSATTERPTLPTALERSRILWPTSGAPRAAELRRARAVMGVRSATTLPATLEDWERVEPIGSDESPDARWLCRLAFGIRPRDVVGAHDWRGHYRRVPLQRRQRIHTVSDAVEWPDPLERPEVESEVDHDKASPVFPVLDDSTVDDEPGTQGAQ